MYELETFVELFRFPLNAILAILWVICNYSMWRNCRKSFIVRFLISKSATISAIAIFLIFCLILGFTGNIAIIHSYTFAIFLLYFQTVLLFVIFRGARRQTATGANRGSVRWRFVLNHLGLLFAVGAAFWGYPDSESYRVRAFRNVPVSESYKIDGSVRRLPYTITLTDCSVDFHENNAPSKYEAEISVDNKYVTLSVNKPYSYKFGEDIYLSAIDTNSDDMPQYCILEIVRQPWNLLVLIGIIMMITGAFTLFIYGPDRFIDKEGRYV